MSSVPLSTHWHWLSAYWRFYRKARTVYDVHSPFLYQFIQQVADDERGYYLFDRMRMVRHYWLQSNQVVTYEDDHGAGSRAGQGGMRFSGEIARHSTVDRRTGELLFRLALFQRPRHILELGTNLGFSAAYLSGAAPQARIITVEANETLAQLAEKTWQLAGVRAPRQRIGTFADHLPAVLSELKQLDLLWLDGDHREEATIRYVEQCLPYCHEHSVIAIADIHWSPGMERAWERLQALPGVSESVDLFQVGLLFFRSEQREKQDLCWVPAWQKPWRMGFFT